MGGANDCRLPSSSLLDYIGDAPDHSKRVASIRTGGFVLAAAGLLDGKRATTHWVHADEFRRKYPQVLPDEDRLFVVDAMKRVSRRLRQ